jgi:hypothetical protein
LVVFAPAWGLHRGLDGLRDLTHPTALQFKLWAIVTLLISVALPLVLALRRLGLDPRRALLFAEPGWKRTAVAVPLGVAVAFAFNHAWPAWVSPSARYLEEMRKFIGRETAVEYLLVLVGGAAHGRGDGCVSRLGPVPARSRVSPALLPGST